MSSEKVKKMEFHEIIERNLPAIIGKENPLYRQERQYEGSDPCRPDSPSPCPIYGAWNHIKNFGFGICTK